MGIPDASDAALSRRLRLYPKLLLAALTAAFVFVIVTGDGSSTASGRVGGDYPAFYGAGSIVRDGHLDGLYDPDVQAAAQAGLLGAEDGYLAFAYAPHVAAAYSPLAALDYRVSYVVHTFVMVAALIGALHLLRPLIAVADRWFALVLVATVTFYPMFMALGGGQNTALTVLMFAAVWRALAEDREVAAGLATTLLLFRPQYALPIIGLLLLDRRRTAVLTAAVGALVVYAANAAILGWSWVSTWLDRVGPFLETDAEVNAGNSVSAVGFLQALFGVDSPLATAVGGLISVAVVVVLALAWRQDRLDLGARMAITATGIVLLSPHAMFYDAGLLALTILVLVDRGRLTVVGAAAIWGLGLTHLLDGVLDATPFALVTVVVFCLAVRRLTRVPAPDAPPLGVVAHA